VCPPRHVNHLLPAQSATVYIYIYIFIIVQGLDLGGYFKYSHKKMFIQNKLPLRMYLKTAWSQPDKRNVFQCYL